MIELKYYNSFSYGSYNPLKCKKVYGYISFKLENSYQTYKIRLDNKFDFYQKKEKKDSFYSYSIFVKEKEKKTFFNFFKKERIIENVYEIKYSINFEKINNIFTYKLEGLLPIGKVSLIPQESLNNLLDENETKEFLHQLKKIKKF